ncbi:MAG: V-type ATPase subunit [Myxococcales bacterium]|nr:V-type ATPase subunit [Myxococcales bacterium]MDH3483441.1 V-type ATPase subunit [Myxococcales bacterium]
MATFFGDINARARGLRTHLLPPSTLDRLARAPSLFALQRDLAALGFVRPDAPATTAALEQAVRRHAAAQVAILSRWSEGPRRTALAAVFEDEDRRSIQSIVRGAAQGAPADARLAGLVPTASLPERALQALAAQPTVKDVIHLLGWWQHPLAPPLLRPGSKPHPSLFRIEVALNRAFALRVKQAARKADRHLAAYVTQVVDIMNAWSVLLHFDEHDPAIVDLTFIDGGSALPRDAFQRLMSLQRLDEVGQMLVRQFRGSFLSSAFRRAIDNVAELESTILRAQIDQQNRSFRVDPGGTAPIIGYALELRAEVVSLRRIVWGVALRAPSSLLFPGLETA